MRCERVRVRVWVVWVPYQKYAFAGALFIGNLFTCLGNQEGWRVKTHWLRETLDMWPMETFLPFGRADTLASKVGSSRAAVTRGINNSVNIHCA